MCLIFTFFSGSAGSPDFESSAYGTVLYIMEGVFPFLETFYRDFYFPDQQTHGNECDETDHLAKACVVSSFFRIFMRFFIFLFCYSTLYPISWGEYQFQSVCLSDSGLCREFIFRIFMRFFNVSC